MTNILVTGSGGQLGSEIKELSQNYAYNFFLKNKQELNITDEEAMKFFIETNNIDIIINCAAYTYVDKAEEDEINADKINHLAVKYLAQISKDKDIKLIHISTDYVFDGKSYRPYTESDVPNPNGIYGRTKCDGELAMLGIDPKNSVIIRTSWVYSSFGVNFVKSMLRLGKNRDSLGIISDQVGTPTYARDLAKVILELIPKLKNKNVEIYNYSNEGVLSWYDFAKEIMRMAKLDCQVKPIETKEYPTPCERPYYSLLNKSKIKKEFDVTTRYWKDSLDECLRIMGERK